MKRKGYLLLYVVILIGFLGVVFLYTIERLQLATLVEGNKLNRLRQEIKMTNELTEIMSGHNEHALEIFRSHAGEFALTDRTHARNITTRSGTTYQCKIRVQKSLSLLEWEIRDGADQPYYATQQVRTILDESAQAGGIALREKSERISSSLVSTFGEAVDKNVNLVIRLSSDGNRWIVFESLESADESTEAEPATETKKEEDTPLLPDEETIPDESSDTEEGSDADETEENRDEHDSETDETTELFEEATEEEPNEPVLREIDAIPVNEPLVLILDGSLSVEAEGSKPTVLHSILCLNGEFRIQGVEVRGIVLHEGEAQDSINGGSVYGYYESDLACNPEKVKYRNNRLHWVRMGMRLPDFIQFHTGLIRREAPKSFQD